MRWFHTVRAAALLAALLGAAGTMPAVHASGAGEAEAGVGDAGESDLSAFGTPVTADALEDTRGGFDVPGGLTLALGIERVVSVNGEVMSRTNIAIPDLTTMTADQARLAQEAIGAGRLIQIGNNNFAAPDLALGNGATVIQNSLNDQTISAYTTITSTVNSMSLLKDLNIQSTIHDALVRSAGNL
ncbi:hypothetical protein [Massilia niastensis]|uniref:hypothetical protein n=1 Tax=Massilia niastensis TaxID=544911 RepID=UPI0003733CAF|nr:hypothetical protein [Massilia niastensis]